MIIVRPSWICMLLVAAFSILSGQVFAFIPKHSLGSPLPSPSPSSSSMKGTMMITRSHGNYNSHAITKQPSTAIAPLLKMLPALILPMGVIPSASFALDAKGEKLFEANCVSCHVGGGNVIGYARGKTLKADALKKNKFDTKESIVHLLEEGKGVMPKYASYTRKNGELVPAKLSEKEMLAVADYILEQAQAGWQ